MEEEELGPNGGVLYALEELEGEEGWEWMESGLKGLGEDYVLFDCPGQVELFTHHGSLRNIFVKIQKMGYRVRHAPPSLCPEPPANDAFLFDPIVDSAPPNRFLHTHPALTLHLNRSPIPPRHAPNGSSAPERAHENRQVGKLRPSRIQPRFLYRSTRPFLCPSSPRRRIPRYSTYEIRRPE